MRNYHTRTSSAVSRTAIARRGLTTLPAAMTSGHGIRVSWRRGGQFQRNWQHWQQCWRRGGSREADDALTPDKRGGLRMPTRRFRSFGLPGNFARASRPREVSLGRDVMNDAVAEAAKSAVGDLGPAGARQRHAFDRGGERCGESRGRGRVRRAPQGRGADGVAAQSRKKPRASGR